MAEPTRPIIGVTELRQVCIVVHDLQKSMEHYQNILGIGPWEVFEINESITSNTTYHGQVVQHSFSVALATVGSIQLELIQPLKGDNIYSDFLKEHGEGSHHLGHVVVNNIDEAIQTYACEGFPCLQSGHIVNGKYAGRSYAYVDTVKALGTIIELVKRPQGMLISGSR